MKDTIERHLTRDIVGNSDGRYCDYCSTEWHRINGYCVWWNNECIRVCDNCLKGSKHK